MTNPQPWSPFSDLRPCRTSVPSSGCSRSSHPTSAATPAHSWTEDETVGSLQDLKGFHGSLWKLHPVLPRRGRGQRHMVDKKQYRGGKSHPPGAQPRSPQPALGPLTQPHLIAGFGVTSAVSLCLGGFHQSPLFLHSPMHLFKCKTFLQLHTGPVS